MSLHYNKVQRRYIEALPVPLMLKLISSSEGLCIHFSKNGQSSNDLIYSTYQLHHNKGIFKSSYCSLESLIGFYFWVILFLFIFIYSQRFFSYLFIHLFIYVPELYAILLLEPCLEQNDVEYSNPLIKIGPLIGSMIHLTLPMEVYMHLISQMVSLH